MVKNCVILVALAACLLSGVTAKPQGRILDGDATKNGQFPWVVSVRVNSVHTCGGTIISESHIITAAHCVSEELTKSIPESIVSVRVGSYNQLSGGKLMSVKNITIHPNMASFSNDLAILTLTEALTFTEKIQKVDLAPADYVLMDDATVSVVGWGVSKVGGASPFKLQQATYSVYSPQDCEYLVGFGFDWSLCLNHAKGKGICTGDDGAGIMENNKLVGVASFVFGAGGTEFPDIASRISYYYDWITQVMTQ